MKVKYLAILLVLLLLMIGTYSFAASSSTTVSDDELSKINMEINEYYKLGEDYFFQKSKASNRQLYKYKFNYYDDIHEFFIYGTTFGDSMTFHGEVQLRYLGYTKDNAKFENPNFPWDSGWSGDKYCEFNFISTPWDDPRSKDECEIGDFSGLKDSKGNYILEKSIQDGLDNYFDGTTGKDWLPAGKSVANRDKIVHNAGDTHDSGKAWSEFVCVLQPPTYNYWGTGVAFIENLDDQENPNYITVPLAPHNIGNNIALTNIKNNKENVEKGKTYQCSVTIGNSLLEDLNNVDIQFFQDGVEVLASKTTTTLKKGASSIIKFPTLYQKTIPKKK